MDKEGLGTSESHNLGTMSGLREVAAYARSHAEEMGTDRRGPSPVCFPSCALMPHSQLALLDTV